MRTNSIINTAVKALFALVLLTAAFNLNAGTKDDINRYRKGIGELDLRK